VRSLASAILQFKPTAYWRLAETTGTAAADAAWRAPSDQTVLTYNGAPALNQVGLAAGDPSPSVALNGSSQYAISATNLLHFNFLLPFSIVALVRPAATPAAGQFGRVIGKGGGWRLTYNSSNQMQFNQTASDGTTGSVVSAALTLSTNYFVAYTFDGTTMSMSVNAGTATTAAYAKYPVQNNNAVTIGASDGTSAFFNGRLQCIAIIPSALTPTQISSIYTSVTTVPTKTVPPANAASIISAKAGDQQVSIVFDHTIDDGGDPITQHRIRAVSH
jgi:hypothetical protein